MKKLLSIFAIVFACQVSFASQGLVIHTTEMGVGKFHRYDNRVHPYDKSSAWVPYILPDGVGTDKMLVQKNADASYTIFFTNLDEMLAAAVQISQKEQKQVSVLNVHGHGLPGAMWFPSTAEELSSWTCSDWQHAAAGDDVDNYNQYYSAVSLNEINQIHEISDNPDVHMGCTTGVTEWQTATTKNPTFKTILADDAQIHFLSCVVGLGSQGDGFTKGIAALLLSKTGTHASGRVEASMDFGLGDWSMPGGMGFWDYKSDEQLNHDNEIYPVNHKDSEIAQKGTVRRVTLTGTEWTSAPIGNLDVMSLRFDTEITGTPMAERVLTISRGPVPTSIRIPGTKYFAHVSSY
jgi:hypothetical protein